MSIREMWANRILSVLMIAVLLYTFFGNRQNVVNDMTQAEIDSKPSKNYVDDQDRAIIKDFDDYQDTHQIQHEGTQSLLQSMDRKIDILLTDK